MEKKNTNIQNKNHASFMQQGTKVILQKKYGKGTKYLA
jgi:hypothetical protein